MTTFIGNIWLIVIALLALDVLESFDARIVSTLNEIHQNFHLKADTKLQFLWKARTHPRFLPWPHLRRSQPRLKRSQPRSRSRPRPRPRLHLQPPSMS